MQKQSEIDPQSKNLYFDLQADFGITKHMGGMKATRKLVEMGFRIVATRGTTEFLKGKGVPCEPAYRISERKSPNALDLMREGKIHLIVNTPSEVTGTRRDGYAMRRLAVELGIPFITALSSAKAEIMAIKAARKGELTVRPLQKK